MRKTIRIPAGRARQRGFFDFSISELAIIFGVALVVLGPKKLPGLVAQVGRLVGRARHMARQFREQLETEVNSINAVKPVPRHVPPVEPTTPGPEVAAASSAAAAPHEESHVHAADVGPLDQPTVADAMEPLPVPEAPHPEAQIYFAMNGTEPAAATTNPFASAPETDSVPAAEHPEAGSVSVLEPGPEPASVKVVFPHDHG